MLLGASIILILLLSITLFFSLRLNLKNRDRLTEISEKIEESLDILDVCYQRAATRSELEVFSDEPVIKELVEDIQISKNAILLVANLLTEPMNNDEGE
jgi:hypothetical protein